MTELRNPAIQAELERAIATGSHAGFFSLLARFSGLPGPQPNDKLGWAVARALAAHGARADALVRDLCAVGRGAERGTGEFLPIVGAYCLAARFVSGADAASVLAALRPLAEDSRHLVREGVVRALAEMGRARGDGLVESLAAWTDGYLSASAALLAVGTRSWLDAQRSAEPAIARLDESFALTENASRSDQRSQGYRELLKVIPDVAARLMDRFPEATLAWFESKAGTEHVELREALDQLAVNAREHGHARGKLERFERLFDASAPPRRDPKTYVGPTRKRGSRRR
jgi:hypothetical protein